MEGQGSLDDIPPTPEAVFVAIAETRSASRPSTEKSDFEHMTAFISHSFENEPELEHITDALVQRGVDFWNPAEIRPGASLREQLRAAVERCALCIFVATRQSVGSRWCGAEPGAFWGAGKPIIGSLAEASLKEEELLQGHTSPSGSPLMSPGICWAASNVERLAERRDSAYTASRAEEVEVSLSRR